MESVPPSSSTISRTAVLILRVLTFVFLLIALIVIAIAKQTVYDVGLGLAFEVKFNDVYAYRLVFSSLLIQFIHFKLRLRVLL